MTSTLDRRPRLLLVDDEPTNLQVLRQALQNDYRLLFATSGERALLIAQEQLPDLVLLDVMMPHMDGYAVCRTLKADTRTLPIPVIFITALNSSTDEATGFDAGAVDYITKPISLPVARARVRTHLSLVRMEELRETRLRIVQRLGRAAEYKDYETGMHIIRMSHFTRLIALAAGHDATTWADELFNAAPMHDVGKIGIPDHILRKPDALTAEERSVMQRHTEIGAEIIGEHPSGILQLAREVALGHHEKWDGSGYPYGLRGGDNPISARIVALADVFDALTSHRPYKEGWPVEHALAHIESESGRHFDPILAPLLRPLLPQFQEIQQRWSD